MTTTSTTTLLCYYNIAVAGARRHINLRLREMSSSDKCVDFLLGRQTIFRTLFDREKKAIMDEDS